MKNKNIFILIMVLVAVSGGFFVKSIKPKNETEIVSEMSEEGREVNDEEELTPEEVIARLSGESEMNGEMTVKIISPEEETFVQSQARMYEIEITNQPSNTKVSCDWKFYLNQYDEEELYQERKTTGSNICGFTDTFIKNRGKLRVTVDVVAINTLSSKEITRASAEAKYEVR